MNAAIDTCACFNCKIISFDCKILNCCHSLCGECVNNYACNGTLHCPNCQTNTDLTQLSDNFVLSEVMNALQFDNKFQAGKKCSNCSSIFPSKALYYCIECRKLLCAHDYSKHQQTCVPLHHHVVKNDRKNPPQTVSDFMCRHTRKANLYCLCNSQAICRYCAKKDHTGHEYVALADFHRDRMDELTKKLQTISNKVNSINEYVKSLDKMSRDLDSYEKKTVSDIISYYDETIRNIQQRQRLELHDFFSEMEDRKKTISNTIHQAKQLKSLLRQTHKFIKSSSLILPPPKFLANVSFLNSRAESIIEKTQDFNFNHRTVIRPFNHEYYRVPIQEGSVDGSVFSIDSSLGVNRTWYNSSTSTRNTASQAAQHHFNSIRNNQMRYANNSKAATVL